MTMGQDSPGMWSSPFTLKVQIRNFVVITHAVPAERVRAVLPADYDLQTFAGDGGETCLVSATCFCNHDFRYGLGFPRMTFDENTLRTYVAYRGRPGVYFFGRYLSSSVATAGQKTLSRHVWKGDFDVDTDLSEEGYESYRARTTGEIGDIDFVIEAGDAPAAPPPFESPDDHAQFITYRPSGLFTSQAGLQGHMPVGHRRMDPWAGRLVAGRFEPWERWGILLPDEHEHVYSVLVEPVIDFTLYPPRPAFP